jgi:hypothetical protein
MLASSRDYPSRNLVFCCISELPASTSTATGPHQEPIHKCGKRFERPVFSFSSPMTLIDVPLLLRVGPSTDRPQSNGFVEDPTFNVSLVMRHLSLATSIIRSSSFIERSKQPRYHNVAFCPSVDACCDCDDIWRI